MDVYYDGECPFCARYIEYQALQVAVGLVRLHNLREHPNLIREFKKMGYDANKGMIVFYNERYYYGPRAMALLNRLSERRGGAVGSVSKLLGRVAELEWGYAFLTCGRRVSLWVLQRKMLGKQEDAGTQALLSIFSFALGVFFVLHALVYSFQFLPGLKTVTLLIAGCGIYMMLRPSDLRGLSVAILLALVGAFIHAPIYSNHTILLNFLLLSMFLSGGWVWFKHKGATEFLNGFAAVGRLLLLIMYFFGVFHKINTDFLSTSVSCAKALWHDMPFYWEGIGGDFWIYLGIYGTLIIEAIIFACLLMPRMRWFGILAGIAFHSILAWSGYALYAAFSMLTVCLHILFLSPGQALTIMKSDIMQRVLAIVKSPSVSIAFFAAFSAMAFLAYWRQYAYVGVLWTILMLPFFVALLGGLWQAKGYEYGLWEAVKPSPGFFLVLPALFVFNCFTPYMGLKTAQSMNMFANLQLEGGQNNHLIMRAAPWPFGYLDEAIEILEVRRAPYLNYIKKNDLRVVLYDLVDSLERHRDAQVTFRRNGTLYEMVSYEELPRELKAILHPRWFRAWFHFTPVDVKQPKACALDR